MSELARDRLATLARAAIGAMLVVTAIQVRAPLAVLMGLAGAWLLGRALTRLIRISAVTHRVEWQRATSEFDRATLPRQIFWLLLAVAEVDGKAEEAEQRLVREFLLLRFQGPVTERDLLAWEQHRVPASQLRNLASALRRTLTPAERETVFYWSCQIAFADRRFKQDEHRALHDVAAGLGLRGTHARVIFHHAKARFLSRDENEGNTWGEQRSGWDRTRRAQHSSDPRRQALETLGLDENASKDDIRKRHRELVKLHHPDAHTHLGPVAAEEAAARFREIQQAYELLGAGR